MSSRNVGRLLVSQLSRRLISSASQSIPTANTPYKTPGPTVTRKRLRDRFGMGPYEIPGEPRPEYPKRRSPLKRTTALIKALNEEEGLRLIKDGKAIFPKNIPNPRSGDLIRIAYVHTLAEERRPQYFMGICIAVRKSGLGSTVVLRNVVEGVAVERGFPIYSPLIKDAQLVGRRKVRRSKLYYLRDKPLKDSTIANATKRPATET
eukprot:GFKZ01010804.1.p1 GENE.GFKZ01010804.1~~GFKZ01010804.1.p1  ORF type:complete len:206 (+),score=17.81 GFKZ01010804.1:120-737(+)